MPCSDHVRVECWFCREITRQCRCMGATPKRLMFHAMCSACAKQMPTPPKSGEEGP